MCVTSLLETRAVSKTQLAQGARHPGGKLRDVKRPACREHADRRVSKLRQDCHAAWPQACRIGRSERRVPTDDLRTRLRAPSQASSDRSDQPQPPDRARRVKRSTPAHRTGAQREKDQRHLQPPDRTEDEGPSVKPRRFGPRWLRRTNVKLRIASIPSWVTQRSARATGITHPDF